MLSIINKVLEKVLMVKFTKVIVKVKSVLLQLKN